MLKIKKEESSFEAIYAFFETHKIIGRKISDIRCSSFDYIEKKIQEGNNSFEYQECAIETKGNICITFNAGDNLEIFGGDNNSISLAFNTASLNNYPESHNEIYSLNNIFQKVLGYQIVNIMLCDMTDHNLSFPLIKSISCDNQQVSELYFFLRGGTYLKAGWSNNSFTFEHLENIERLPADRIRVRKKELQSFMKDLPAERISRDCGVSESTTSLIPFSSIPIDESEADQEFGNFGFKDEEGNVIIRPQFLSCGDFHFGLCPVALNRTWCREADGREYYEMHWGYIDQTGRMVIPYKFSEAHDFNKYGVAMVKENYSNDEYLIDTNGNILPESMQYYVSPYYDYEDRYIEFSNIDGDWGHNTGLYDTKERKILVPPITCGCTERGEDYIELDETDLGAFCDLDLHDHIINSKGEELFPALERKKFNNIYCVNNEGFAIVGNVKWVECPEEKCSYYPIFGHKFENIYYCGVCDSDGNILIPIQYTYIKYLGNRQYKCKLDGKSKVIRI